MESNSITSQYKKGDSQKSRIGYERLKNVNWPTEDSYGLSTRQRIPRKTASHTGRICILLTLFAIASVMLFKIWHNKSNQIILTDTKSWLFGSESGDLPKDGEHSELLLANVLFRHGDRAPTNLDSLNMSQLLPYANKIWPNGLGGLTDAGFHRTFKVGLKLSQKYRAKLRAHSSQSVLALSSNSPRCLQSLKVLLRAFYNFETTMVKGLNQVRAYPLCRPGLSIENNENLNDTKKFGRHDETEICNVLNDSGWPDEWKRVNIDSESLLVLRSKYPHEKCPNYNKTICPIFESMDNSELLKTIPGYEELKKQIKFASGDEFSFNLAGFLSDLTVLLRYESVPVVREALVPHAKWLFKPVAWRKVPSDLPGRNSKPIVMTLYDTYEELNIMGDDICFGHSTAGFLSTSPIITSLVESQLTALNHHNGIEYKSNSWKKLDYTNKKLVLYATHDTTVEMLLRHLEISEPLGDGHQLFENFLDLPRKSQTDRISPELAGLLSGVKRSEFGASIAFELWKTKGKPYAYIKCLIYQRDDGFYEDIKYEPVKLGAYCRASFRKKYGDENLVSIKQYYPQDMFNFINLDYDCPFELWKNVTHDKMISDERFQQLCFG